MAYDASRLAEKLRVRLSIDILPTARLSSLARPYESLHYFDNVIRLGAELRRLRSRQSYLRAGSHERKRV